MNNIKFLNESISSINEGILFSTVGGREESKSAITKTDKLLDNYLRHCEASTDIMADLYKNFFSGDIVANCKKKFNVLKTGLEKLKDLKDDMSKEVVEIKGTFKGNIFDNMRKKRIFFNRADFKKEEVSDAYATLIKKCSYPDGEYYKRVYRIYQIVVYNLAPLIDTKEFVDRIRATITEFGPDTDEYDKLDEFIYAFRWWRDQIKYTAGDVQWTSDQK